MHPKLLLGWWQKDAGQHLMQFASDLQAGKRPILLIQAPPQHGKSVQVVDFLAWLAGHNPDLRTIYASFSERLGVRANLQLQRMFDSRKYRETFNTRISEKNAVKISAQTLRNREIIEFVGHEGYFRNTTVRGAITGEGLDLGVIDDPIKGREEAQSATVRERTWDWFTDDFLSRFSDKAGLLGIMTRWHVDDPFGRLIEHFPQAKVLKYPAIAENDEIHRRAGEALFPEHKSLEFLLDRKAVMHPANWSALYQQNPTIEGGGLFRDEWWQYWTLLPKMKWRALYADTAQKTGTSNDYTVIQCWGESVGGQAVLIDQIRGKWEAPELLAQARAFWHKHKQGEGTLRAFKIEDKVSGTGLIQTLRREGVPVVPINRNKDKVTRAMDAAPLVQSGNVLLPQSAPWLSDFLHEVSLFPAGAHDDQVDPMMDAVSDILMPPLNQVFIARA